MTNLYLMVGIPGSGKSTWARQKQKEDGGIIVSRDEIRFKYINENEDYFAAETKVFDEFVNTINTAIADNTTNVFIDATHITQKSRNKILDKLTGSFTIFPVYFNTKIETCQTRNDLREGLRKVPRGTIRRMYYSLEPPTHNEKYKYANIMEVKE